MNNHPTFTELLASQVSAWETFTADDGYPGLRARTDLEVAEAFLATPQMQEIKIALRKAKELSIEVFEWAFCE